MKATPIKIKVGTDLYDGFLLIEGHSHRFDDIASPDLVYLPTNDEFWGSIEFADEYKCIGWSYYEIPYAEKDRGVGLSEEDETKLRTMLGLSPAKNKGE